jgi:hypothetical protein
MPAIAAAHFPRCSTYILYLSHYVSGLYLQSTRGVDAMPDTHGKHFQCRRILAGGQRRASKSPREENSCFYLVIPLCRCLDSGIRADPSVQDDPSCG